MRIIVFIVAIHMMLIIILIMEKIINMNNKYRFIHLLYVPTMSCNMACKYCYLEDNTKDEWNKIKPIDTLEYAIENFFKSNVIPFNISLHGGEVTTLSKEDFKSLISFVFALSIL